MTLDSKVKVTYIIKFCLRLVTRILFSFFTKGVHIRHNHCQLSSDNNNSIGIWIRPWSQRSMFNMINPDKPSVPFVGRGKTRRLIRVSIVFRHNFLLKFE